MWDDEETQRCVILLMARAQCLAESRMHKAVDLAVVTADYEDAVRAMRSTQLESWEIDLILDVALQQARPDHHEWQHCHVCRADLMQWFIGDYIARNGA